MEKIPCKKPPKRELSFSQKLYNKLLSPLRVVIEHAHSVIKRLRIVADTVRLPGEPVRYLVLVVVYGLYGLYNLRACGPLRAYLTQAPLMRCNSSG